jgi:Ser/Thr protein kinase RdoA (MazF antagonist)
VADVAYALRDLADDNANSFPMDDARFVAFLDGYRAEKKLTEEALALIPMFLHAHHLVLFTKLSRALNLEQKPDEATWVTNLRQRLKQKMQHYRDEFTAYVR